MTPQTLSTAAAVLLSLLFSYVPGISSWYDKLDATRKRLIMLSLLVLIAAGSFGIACAGWAEAFGIPVTCDQPGAVVILQSLILFRTIEARSNRSWYSKRTASCSHS